MAGKKNPNLGDKLRQERGIEVVPHSAIESGVTRSLQRRIVRPIHRV